MSGPVVEVIVPWTPPSRMSPNAGAPMEPTPVELEAMRELVSNSPGFDETLDAIEIVRAYLKRVSE